MGSLASLNKDERWMFGWRAIAKGWEGRRIERVWAYIQARRNREGWDD